MSALARRKQIVRFMQMRKFDTATCLACEFEVTEKTIYRDVEEMASSGYPIRADRGHDGGIRWLDNERQFPFTEEQMLALKNAILLVSPEYKLVIENMIGENAKPEINSKDIFGLLDVLDIPQRAFAAKLGITESHLSRIISGKRNPSEELKGRILEYIALKTR